MEWNSLDRGKRLQGAQVSFTGPSGYYFATRNLKSVRRVW